MSGKEHIGIIFHDPETLAKVRQAYYEVLLGVKIDIEDARKLTATEIWKKYKLKTVKITVLQNPRQGIQISPGAHA